MQMLGAADKFIGSADSLFNRVTGDGADPVLASPEQQTMDAYQLLEGLGRCDVVEKMSAIEAVSAAMGQEIEMPNRYKIMADKSDPRSMLLYGVETTNMCCRQLQGGCCCLTFPWQVEIRSVTQNNEAERAFYMERPFAVTCCCFGRPKVEIFDVRGITDDDSLNQGKKIAEITDPCSCIHLTFEVEDGNGDHRMDVVGHGCQPGLCCPLPCGPCSKVDFDVTDEHGNEIGDFDKVVPSCLKFLAAPDVDNYAINFSGNGGSVTDPAMKLTLIALAIFMDFRFFSNNANDDGGSREDGIDFMTGE
jgi:hypothetical protein